MIPFDFDYYKPNSLQEAVQLHDSLRNKGKQPMYYSGGTEIITLGRIKQVYTDAVIDLKHIPETQILDRKHHHLVIGASQTLTRCIESDLFPLLSVTANEVADRTARNKITIGGNVCGAIFYREAVLPFLLSDCELVLAGPTGLRRASIHHVFKKEMKLETSECLVQFILDKSITSLPFYSKKVRKQGNVGYPLVTLAALKIEGAIRLAISGLTPYPFRAFQLEPLLNDPSKSLEERWLEARRALPQDILTDIEGSSEYRLFKLKQLVFECFSAWEGL